jgi:hypothetical protein
MTTRVSGAEGSDHATGCTIAAASGSATRDGMPLLMSTSDDPFATRTRLVVEAPVNGYRFVATQIVSPPPIVSWSNMHTRGVNEAGLAYAWSYVTPASEPTDATAIGIPYYQWGRLVLSEAACVDEALMLLERYPLAFHGNFLFADATGEICLVEVGTETVHVAERMQNGWIGRANHWTSGVKMSVEDAALACSSRQRHARLHERLQALDGDIDTENLMGICRDHAGRDQNDIGYSICAHGHHGESPVWFGTVSSEVTDPRSRVLWYCYGWPCGEAPERADHQLYQEFSWGTYLPFDLPQLEPGEYVTTDGRLTALALRYLARHQEQAGTILTIG